MSHILMRDQGKFDVVHIGVCGLVHKVSLGDNFMVLPLWKCSIE